MDLPAGLRGRFRWLLLIVVVALVVGASAALLSGPAGPFTPTSGSAGNPVSFATVSLIFGWTILGLVGLMVGFHLYRRRTEGSIGIPNRILVSFLVAVLIAIAFILIVRAGFVGHGSLFPLGPVGPGNSSSQPPSTSVNNSSLPPLGNVPLGGVEIPGWLLFVGIAIVAVVGVLVAVPVIASLRDRPSPPGDGSARESTRKDLADAIRALDEAAARDARTVIIDLYARLLRRIGSSLEGIAAMAPREIESNCVRQLKVRPSTANELTRLFEEARYSTHALPSTLIERARDVFQRAIDDLDHPPVLP
ncbi:MAG TPA: hypothetical protein VEY07_03440 [Thermoplasmata archaeon]|nr:hypothetical protein [Thermoplasmata archaeon]